MTKVQKKKIVFTNYCNEYWDARKNNISRLGRFCWDEFKQVIAAAKLYQEIGAQIILDRCEGEVRFVHPNGKGCMPVEDFTIRQLQFYFNN